MHVDIGKLLSLLVAFGYLVGMVIATGNLDSGLFCVGGYLLGPLALIWFPEFFGSFTGYVGRGGNIDTETPPFLVTFFGWFFLVGFPILSYIWSASQQ